ncbi:MAG: 6,7-dimethyl-8-ribityllumazine synthase [Chloroflexi bacterium]|nr:6,7-dimethyl-8-ribityllumazine synthase [Chloroflexota bacterium]
MSHTSPGVGIVVGRFHHDIASTMVEAASEAIREAGAELVETVWVAGSYETPLAAQALLRAARIDVVVVLGFIERGETLHGEVMGHVVHRALVELSLRHEKPVGIGIIGPGATAEQAHARKVDYAKAAVRAALDLHLTLARPAGSDRSA